MSRRSRPCPAPGCQVLITREEYACRRHWFALPQSMRSRIWRAYRGRDLVELADAHAEADAFLERAA